MRAIAKCGMYKSRWTFFYYADNIFVEAATKQK
jgi:hypothetical protein